MTTLSRWVFLASGTWAVLCAPAILLAERFGWQRSLALVVGALSGLWVAFFSYVLLTFDLGMD